ncbi:hypothetical protein [Streptomyces cellostaticus]|uniref:hypothetical protein n=1 Tax=Streptomyces TaxID=1883 RepID=UPI002026EEAE|nr:hypothetical protein [Streptomyces cellostaticus]
MNGFQDRGTVHQVVFRWDGNHGRQGTGMSAVAHSCSPERAERLGQELGRLLWVPGATSARPSVVRTLSSDGGVMLVQRWPTTDRGGRPSTVSHVLFGDPRALKTRQCLGLAYRGWSSQESAERAKGPQPVIDCADLDGLALRRLPGMLEALPRVQHALILATAELLRDPDQRVSLLLEDKPPRDWPDENQVPLVYLGLFLIFHSWLRQEWTFATYDTVDTHPLRLMAVPQWEPDAGGSGPLARITGRRPGPPQFEQRAAARLVEHLLANRDAPPGVPQLVGELADGAALDWDRRRDRLRDILGTDRPQARTRHRTGQGHGPEPLTGRDREPVAVRDPAPPREPAPPRDPAPLLESPPRPARPPESPPRPVRAPEPVSPAHSVPAPAPGVPLSPEPDPAPVQGAPTEYGTGGHRLPSLPDGFDTAAAPPGLLDSALHHELCRYRRADGAGNPLMARLGRCSDEALLDELVSNQLTPDAVDAVLTELGMPQRLRSRRPETRHALCTEVLERNLYFAPRSPGTEPTMARAATAQRAARIFGWAVAPLARDEQYLAELRQLFYRMSRDRHPGTGNWIWQTVVEPENGQVPDLPPELWSQLLRDAFHTGAVSAVPPPPTVQPTPAHPVHRTPSTSSGSPESPAGTGPPSSVLARFGELTSSPGCVIGGLMALIAAMIAIVLILV